MRRKCATCVSKSCGGHCPPDRARSQWRQTGAHHGFTARKDGRGFGLHSGAPVARELGGSLTAQSEGTGKGATFTLELPLHSKATLTSLENAVQDTHRRQSPSQDLSRAA
jgi:hypothetical protein